MKPEVFNSRIPERLANPTPVKRFTVLPIAKYLVVFLTHIKHFKKWTYTNNSSTLI